MVRERHIRKYLTKAGKYILEMKRQYIHNVSNTRFIQYTGNKYCTQIINYTRQTYTDQKACRLEIHRLKTHRLEMIDQKLTKQVRFYTYFKHVLQEPEPRLQAAPLMYFQRGRSGPICFIEWFSPASKTSSQRSEAPPGVYHSGQAQISPRLLSSSSRS